MAIIRYLFLSMTIRFVKAAKDPATRLSYCLPGPLVFVAGWVMVFMRQPPALSLMMILAGSAAMRIQASMIEKNPGTSFRNAAIVIVIMVAIFAALGEWVWLPVGLVVAVALLALQRHHNNTIASATPGSYQSQMARARAAQQSQLDL